MSIGTSSLIGRAVPAARSSSTILTILSTDRPIWSSWIQTNLRIGGAGRHTGRHDGIVVREHHRGALHHPPGELTGSSSRSPRRKWCVSSSSCCASLEDLRQHGVPWESEVSEVRPGHTGPVAIVLTDRSSNGASCSSSRTAPRMAFAAGRRGDAGCYPGRPTVWRRSRALPLHHAGTGNET